MSFKLESNLRPFDGSGSWDLWFDRFETIASFLKWEDDTDKARLSFGVSRGNTTPHLPATTGG